MENNVWRLVPKITVVTRAQWFVQCFLFLSSFKQEVVTSVTAEAGGLTCVCAVCVVMTRKNCSTQQLLEETDLLWFGTVPSPPLLLSNFLIDEPFHSFLLPSFTSVTHFYFQSITNPSSNSPLKASSSPRLFRMLFPDTFPHSSFASAPCWEFRFRRLWVTATLWP